MTEKLRCAKWCGRGCTEQEFQLATARAEGLASGLGDGWTPRVHENLGWHASVISPCGRLKVTINIFKEKVDSWTAFLGPADIIGGGWWAVTSSGSPLAAIRGVIGKAQDEVKQKQDMITGLEWWSR